MALGMTAVSPGEPIPGGEAVCRKEKNNLPGGMRYPDIPGPAGKEAPVFVDEPNSGEFPADDFRGAVRRRIDDDDLQRAGEILVEEGAQALPDCPAGVVRGNDD
jgi:hypothetical protein